MAIPHWRDEEWVPISAIEHHSYCPRQCALIHIETIFDENLFTLRGRQFHENADRPTVNTQNGTRIVRALPIWSQQYGLIGKADVVELTNQRAMPIEYKVGNDTGAMHPVYQAVAQALCIREILDCEVPEIAVYYGKNKTRKVYKVTDELISNTLNIVKAIRLMQIGQQLPLPVADKRCRKCSLLDACQPFAVLSAAKHEIERLFCPCPEAGDLP